MADVTELFGSTSLTTPRAAPVVPAAASEAAASMLLIGILTDLAALKQAMVEQQGAVYRAFNDFATEQLAINAGLVESGRHQIAVNGHQADSNAAQNVCNAEVGKLFDMHNKLVEHTNK